ncbi:MAG: NAD(P)H-hydrate dehydratase, partial [Candidatus Methylomirabilales bacterium]
LLIADCNRASLMKVVTAKEIQELDRRAEAEYGISSRILMENAGTGAVRVMEQHFPRLYRSRVVVVCGKGNNGGDGLVVARHLVNGGASVQVLLLAKKEEVKGDAAVNLGIAERSGIPLAEVTSGRDLHKHRESLVTADLIVDAILGTGLTGPAQGIAAEAIQLLNSLGRPLVALDLPSGLGSDDGLIQEPCIRAQLTLTLALPKRSLLLFPAARCAGEVRVVDIGIPRVLLTDSKLPVDLTEPEEIRTALPPRDPDAHKGTYGHVLVLAGSPGKTGAAALCSLAALRAGAGLVTLAVPEGLNDLMEVKLTEVMTVGLPETEERTVAFQARDALLGLMEGKRVLALGPGLSTHPETVRLVASLIQAAKIPLVIDADGITALARQPEVLSKASVPVILTPHPGELGRMLWVPKEEVIEKRIPIAQKVTSTYNVTLVLKGARTLIAEPGGAVHINPTGNPGMATAGVGDVLTGVIAGLISQGLAPAIAAVVGVYLHGLAGDLACQQLGPEAMIASDLLEKLPEAIRALKDGTAPRRAPFLRHASWEADAST